MKDSTSLLLLAGAVLLTGVIGNFVTARAEPAATVARQEPANPRAARHAAILACYDLDRDGRLNASERGALRGDIASGKLRANPRHRGHHARPDGALAG